MTAQNMFALKKNVPSESFPKISKMSITANLAYTAIYFYTLAFTSETLGCLKLCQ